MLNARAEAAEPHPGELVGGARDGDRGDAATLVVRLLTQPGDERCARLPWKREVGDDQIDLDRPYVRTRVESVAGHQHAGAAHRQYVGKRLEAVGVVLDDEDDGATEVWSGGGHQPDSPFPDNRPRRPRVLARNLFACARRARVQRSRRARTETAAPILPATGRGGGAMLKDFRAFLMRRNAADLPVPPAIPAASPPTPTSFPNHILMPPIRLLLRPATFDDLSVTLPRAPYP